MPSARTLPVPVPAEYAAANGIDHPLNVTLRQDALLCPLDEWLASKFDPPRLSETMDELVAAMVSDLQLHAEDDQIDAKIADCDRKLAQYRATLDAGGIPQSSPAGSPRPKPPAPATRQSSALSRSTAAGAAGCR